MGLTLEKEQRLLKPSVGLGQYFEDTKARWTQLARDSFKFFKDNAPPGTVPRPDDVAKTLKPLMEVDPALKDFLASKPLTQKYWISDFCDLVIDRTWKEISDTDAQEE